ncbi:hypothetical protein EAE99_004786 [Botrytis elliptica]|nr:hypothetical protein EAE99_004786 [Botrytis elliptica]
MTPLLAVSLLIHLHSFNKIAILSWQDVFRLWESPLRLKETGAGTCINSPSCMIWFADQLGQLPNVSSLTFASITKCVTGTMAISI